MGSPELPPELPSYDMDTTKIRTMLGWKPKDDVYSMLEQALAELKE